MCMQGADGSSVLMPYANTSDYCVSMLGNSSSSSNGTSSGAVNKAQGSARRLTGRPVARMVPGSQRVVDGNGNDVVQPVDARGRKRLLSTDQSLPPGPLRGCPPHVNYNSFNNTLTRVMSAACGGPGSVAFQRRLAASRRTAAARRQQCHVVVKQTPSSDSGDNTTADVQVPLQSLALPTNGSYTVVPTRTLDQCKIPATPKAELDARIKARREAQTNAGMNVASLGQASDYWTKLKLLAQAVVRIILSALTRSLVDCCAC
jgi:hypothetical protein